MNDDNVSVNEIGKYQATQRRWAMSLAGLGAIGGAMAFNGAIPHAATALAAAACATMLLLRAHRVRPTGPGDFWFDVATTITVATATFGVATAARGAGLLPDAIIWGVLPAQVAVFIALWSGHKHRPAGSDMIQVVNAGKHEKD